MNAIEQAAKDRIAAELKKLDANADGKVDIADASALFHAELAAHGPKRMMAGASFIAGIVIGFIAGRASK